MLSFFRTYQRYFFIIITTIIVISFAFSGSSSPLQTSPIDNKVAFKAIDGREIRQSEIDELVAFLNMDPEDKFDVVNGPRLSLLNKGFFRDEIISTGLGEIIAKNYPEEIESDLLAKQAKEVSYKPYTHPQASFISTENVWATFAPTLKASFSALQKEEKPTTPQALAARARLFLDAKQLPPALLRQIFKYQERQFSWLEPDENLDQLDLSIFGYHTPEDWFGKRFMRLAAEFIINSAKIAEERGYRVSKEEAAADLHYNAELAFNKILQENRYALPFASSDEYLTTQLRRMGLDESQAAKTWRYALLFRKLFQDAGHMVFVDNMAFKAFNDYAEETAEGQIYELPADLKLTNFQQLQKFEIYLSAIAKKRKDLLKLPVETLAATEILKMHPELVQKRYLLEISTLDQQQLTSRVGVKETWQWEINADNWPLLAKEFPELGLKNADSQQARMAALEALDPARRNTVDIFARKAIAAAHPEWITESLKDQAPKTQIVTISYQGDSPDIRGLKDGSALIALLDQATLKGNEQADHENTSKLAAYSADGRHYYRIRVIERLENPEVMTFGEANKKGALDLLLTKELENFYATQKEKEITKYQKDDQSWKHFTDVRDELAKVYFKNILAAVRATQKDGKDLSLDAIAQKRLQSHVEEAKKAIQQDSQQTSHYAAQLETPSADEQLVPIKHLNEQWKLEIKPLKLARNMPAPEIDTESALAMADNAWSEVYSMPNGAVFFFQKLVQKKESEQSHFVENIEKARELFYNSVQQTLGEQLLQIFKEKNAISLNYLNTGEQLQAE